MAKKDKEIVDISDDVSAKIVADKASKGNIIKEICDKMKKDSDNYVKDLLSPKKKGKGNK